MDGEKDISAKDKENKDRNNWDTSSFKNTCISDLTHQFQTTAMREDRDQGRASLPIKSLSQFKKGKPACPPLIEKNTFNFNSISRSNNNNNNDRKNSSVNVKSNPKTSLAASSPTSIITDIFYIVVNLLGLPREIAESLQTQGIKEVYPWQAECLSRQNIYGKGKNILCSAPTSGGKSLVAELLMLRRICFSNHKKALYVLPYTSIVNEKVTSLKKLLRRYNSIQVSKSKKIGVKAFAGSKRSFLGRDTNIAICTIEKANSIINRMIDEGTIDSLTCVCIDEIHMIGDPSRGYILELILSKLNYIRYLSNKVSVTTEQTALSRIEASTTLDLNLLNNHEFDFLGNVDIQVIGLSATLPNGAAIAEWLNAHYFVTSLRPVPLCEMILQNNDLYDGNSGAFLRHVEPKNVAELRNDTASFSFLQKSKHYDYIPSLVIKECIEKNKQVIVFCNSRKGCENLAKVIKEECQSLSFSPDKLIASSSYPLKENDMNNNVEGKNNFSASKIGFLNWLENVKSEISDNILLDVLSQRIAYHHAGLMDNERELVEEGYKAGYLLCIFATSTLGTGINLPATRVIFRSIYLPYASDDTSYIKDDDPSRERVSIKRNKYLFPLAQYRQMAGRAGRNKNICKEHGEVILIIPHHLPSYVMQEYQGKKNLRKEERDQIVSEKTKKDAMSLCKDLLPSIKPMLSPGKDGGNSLARALLEMIASKIVKTLNHVDEFLQCTLTYHFLHDCHSNKSSDPNGGNISASDLSQTFLDHGKSALHYLTFYNLVEMKHVPGVPSSISQTIFTATKLGRGIFRSGFPPVEGLQVYHDITRAQQKLILSTDLHLLYMVTPLGMSDLKPNYNKLSQWYKISRDRNDENLHSVCDSLGLTDEFLVKMAFQGPNKFFEGNSKKEFIWSAIEANKSESSSASYTNSSKSEEIKQIIYLQKAAHRLWNSLALYDIMQGREFAYLNQTYQVKQGELQILRRNTVTFAAQVNIFADFLGWRQISLLLKNVLPRMKEKLSKELRSLLSIPDMTLDIANALVKAGIVTPEDLAHSRIAKVMEEISLGFSFRYMESSKDDGELVNDTNQKGMDIFMKSQRFLEKRREEIASIAQRLIENAKKKIDSERNHMQVESEETLVSISDDEIYLNFENEDKEMIKQDNEFPEEQKRKISRKTTTTEVSTHIQFGMMNFWKVQERLNESDSENGTSGEEDVWGDDNNDEKSLKSPPKRLLLREEKEIDITKNCKSNGLDSDLDFDINITETDFLRSRKKLLFYEDRPNKNLNTGTSKNRPQQCQTECLSETEAMVMNVPRLNKFSPSLQTMNSFFKERQKKVIGSGSILHERNRPSIFENDDNISYSRRNHESEEHYFYPQDGVFFSLENYLNDHNLSVDVNYIDPVLLFSYDMNSEYNHSFASILEFITDWKAQNVLAILPLYKDLTPTLRGVNFLNEPKSIHPWTFLESHRPSPLPSNFIKDFNMDLDNERKGILTGIAISFGSVAHFLPFLPPLPLLSDDFRENFSQGNLEHDICERPFKISRQNNKDISLGDCIYSTSCTSITQAKGWQQLDSNVLEIIFSFCGFEHNVSPQELVILIERSCVNSKPTDCPSGRMMRQDTTGTVPILTTNRNTVSLLCKRWCDFYRRWYNENLCKSTLNLFNEVLGEKQSSSSNSGGYPSNRDKDLGKCIVMYDSALTLYSLQERGIVIGPNLHIEDIRTALWYVNPDDPFHKEQIKHKKNLTNRRKDCGSCVKSSVNLISLPIPTPGKLHFSNFRGKGKRIVNISGTRLSFDVSTVLYQVLVFLPFMAQLEVNLREKDLLVPFVDLDCRLPHVLKSMMCNGVSIDRSALVYPMVMAMEGLRNIKKTILSLVNEHLTKSKTHEIQFQKKNRLVKDYDLNSSQDVYHLLYVILEIKPSNHFNSFSSKATIEKAEMPWTGVDGDDDFDVNAYQISLNVEERSSLMNTSSLANTKMVNSKFLRRIAHHHQVIGLILEWRRLSRAVNMMKSLYHHAKYDFGSLRASSVSPIIDVIKSSTGRILMTNPPLQLIPKIIDLSGYLLSSIHEEIQKTISTSLVDRKNLSIFEECNTSGEKNDVIVFNAEDEVKYNQRGPFLRLGRLRKIFYDKYISDQFQVTTISKNAEHINGLTLAQYWNKRGHNYEPTESHKICTCEVELYKGYGRNTVLLTYPTDQVYRRLPLPITEDYYDTMKLNQQTYKPRNVIKASEGMILLSLDYREIELRLLAHFSEDEALIKNFQEGTETDFFVGLTCEWKNIEQSQVDCTAREETKLVFYAWLYGQGCQSLADHLNVSIEEGYKLHEIFLNKCKGVGIFLSSLYDTFRRDGYIKTICGRKRYLPSLCTGDDSAIYQRNRPDNELIVKNIRNQFGRRRQCINTLCQGSAADLLKLALLKVFDRINSMDIDNSTRSFTGKKEEVNSLSTDIRILMCIHDEVVLEVRKDKIHQVAQILKQDMKEILKEKLTVPLDVKVTIGETFGDLTELKI